jgi:drug/metabolite transporter (DMT)-like permease
MPLTAVILALSAAGLHALWNLQLAGARDSEAATAVSLVCAAILFAPVAAVIGDVRSEAIPFMVGSSALELLYFALLGAAYRRAELSVVYPLSRGCAPVLVLAAGVTVAGVSFSWLQAGGVLLVAAGVLLVRDLRDVGDRGDIVFGLAIAGTIAGYTLVDKQGIRHANPVTYLELVLLAPAAIYLAAVARLKGMLVLRAAAGVRTITAALAMFGAYGLVLAALRLAPAPAIAAIRESSVVIATALAAIVLNEAVGSRRLGGALLVVAGIALLGLA